MPRYDQTISTPAQPPGLTAGEIRRPLNPVELAGIASTGGAIVALILAVLLDRPWPELWRWLAIGFVLPVAILVFGAVAPLILWIAETLTRRDLNHDTVIGEPPPPEETIRLLPVRSQAPRIRLAGAEEGYPEEDLRALIEIAYGEGYAVRDFMGKTLPSGRRIANYDSDLRPFFDMLVKSGLLVGRSPRNKGRLLGDLDAALNLFGLL